MGLIMGVRFNTSWRNAKGKHGMLISPDSALCSVLLCPKIQNLISASREALNGFHAV